MVFEQNLRDLISTNEPYFHVLSVLSSYKREKLWVGGGFIRNLVWDTLHNIRTKNSDIDVFYFNHHDTSKENDLQIEKWLKSKEPLCNWSVKNQARMHVCNGDKPYKDLYDAVEKFPETSSAVICRLKNGAIDIIAPHSLKDLFNLKLRPTRHFRMNEKRMLRYEQRVLKKKWLRRYNKLSQEINYSGYSAYDTNLKEISKRLITPGTVGLKSTNNIYFRRH